MKSSHQILVVDSNPNDVRLVREVLESAGLGIHVRTEATSAIEAFHAIQPDLVLIDARLPDTGGAHVTRELKQTELGRSTPIILMSEESADASVQPAALNASGCAMLLQKPLSSHDLLDALLRFLPNAFASMDSLENPQEPSPAKPKRKEPRSARKKAAGHDLSSAFDEESLGALLDQVFPSSDSGNLSAAILEGSQEAAKEKEALRPSEESAHSQARPAGPEHAPLPADPARVGGGVTDESRARVERPKDTLPAASPDIVSPRAGAKGPGIPLSEITPPAGSSVPSGSGHPAGPGRAADPTHPPSVKPTITSPSQNTVRRREHSVALPPVRREESIPQASPSSIPLSSPSSIPLSSPSSTPSSSPSSIPSSSPSSIPLASPSSIPLASSQATAISKERETSPSEEPPRTPIADVGIKGSYDEAQPSARRSSGRRIAVLAVVGAVLAAGAAIFVWLRSVENDLRPATRSDSQSAPARSDTSPSLGSESAGAARSDTSPSLGVGAVEAGDPFRTGVSDTEVEGAKSIGPIAEGPALPPVIPEPSETLPDTRAGTNSKEPTSAGVSKSSKTKLAEQRAAPSQAAGPSRKASQPKTSADTAKSSRTAGKTARGGTPRSAAASPAARPEPPSPAKPAPTKDVTSTKQPSKATTGDVERAKANPPPASVAPAEGPGADKSSEPVQQDPAASSSAAQSSPAPAIPGDGASGESKADPFTSEVEPFASAVPLSRPSPEYPPLAREMRLTGTVKLLVKVGADGKVADVRVTTPAAEPLNKAAVDAVYGWAYKPATRAGNPVSTWVEETVDFKLD